MQLILASVFAAGAFFVAAFVSRHVASPIGLPQGVVLGTSMLFGCRLAGKLTKHFSVTLFSVTCLSCIVSLLFVPIVVERTPNGAPWWYHQRFEFVAYIFSVFCGLVTILLIDSRPLGSLKITGGATGARNAG